MADSVRVFFTDAAQKFNASGKLGKMILLQKGNIQTEMIYDEFVFGMLANDLPSMDMTFGQDMPPKLIKASMEKQFLVD